MCPQVEPNLLRWQAGFPSEAELELSRVGFLRLSPDGNNTLSGLKTRYHI